eukprot:GFUD01104458.1.p1 GENE.GFUD01104458.1~~GFUD01104458.1.p1  ORF type:complete len:292 (-),score=87.47 GFUD01104458.1:40-915(-)
MMNNVDFELEDVGGEASSNLQEENECNSFSEKSPLDLLIELGLVEVPKEPSEKINIEPRDEIVVSNPSMKTISIEDIQLIDMFSENVEVIISENLSELNSSSVNTVSGEDFLLVDPTSEAIKVISEENVGKVKAFTSGYAYFVHLQRAELDKVSTKSMLNMVLINEKWKNLSQAEKDIYNNDVRDYKLPKAKKSVTQHAPKVKKNHAPKVKKNSSYCESVLTNREFVDKFEAVDLKTEKFSDRNKKVSELISEKKSSILKNSLEIQQRKDSEAKYKDRYQRLFSLHGHCNN